MNQDWNTELSRLAEHFQRWAVESLFSFSTVLQIGIFIAALLFGALLKRPLAPVVNHWQEKHQEKWYEPAINGLREVLYPFFTLLFLWLFTLLFTRFTDRGDLLEIAGTLIAVWIGVRFISCFVRQERLARFLAFAVWALAALSILGLLTPARNQLNAIGMSFGTTRITLLIVLKAILAFAGMLWLSGLLIRIVDRQVQTFASITPSLRVLMTKIAKVVLLFLAFVITLNTLGINLTSLAWFSGAFGVGLGFGLQKVVSNFIGGIILLLDRSIKPGDVIFIPDTQTYGWVNTLGARCVSVITRDGKEHLIPNEMLITEKVENWSFSSNDVRIKINVSIAHDSDIRMALKQMKEAAAGHPRVLSSPPPNALLRQIIDHKVELELRAWIDDPVNGIGNITSEILLDIWDRFSVHHIRFPYMQQDIHLKSGSVVTVTPGRNDDGNTDR